ncbi:lipase family alpha/beta hydrolase [Amycolatopsis thermoflava]|uniref:lipase family alpha/beta hydrolase n=1 Tax=Amycolatopsis thermoflava TaxID=84480 RepID=UPI003D70DEB1
MRSPIRHRLLAVVAATLLAVTGWSGVAGADTYAPVDRPGPALTAPRLADSLNCTADVRNATREPVLLTPATTVDSEQNFGFTYERLFRQLGIPYCTSDSPVDRYNMGDLQVRAQYVTYAIREMYKLAGRPIAVMGHSQGGMIMRWSLRFWPDTRHMVDDVIGMAGTNHGSVVVPALCVPDCAPALWQQRANSEFVKALNSGQETFPGISYTEIYSRTDEFVQPNLDDHGTSSLHGGGGNITNVAVQEVCPLAVPEHLLIGTLDPVTSALAIDALTHPGPADPVRIERSVCGRLLMPGAHPVTGPLTFATLTAQVTAQLTVAAHRVPSEPALACYVTARCP